MAVTTVQGVTVNNLTLAKYKQLKNSNSLVNTETYVITDIDDYLSSTLPVAIPSEITNTTPFNSIKMNKIRKINNKLVAVGNSGNLYVSINGIDWTNYVYGTSNLLDVCYFKGKYYVSTYSSGLYSGNNLSNLTLNGMTTSAVKTLSANDNIIVAGTINKKIYYSTDGITWTMVSLGGSTALNGMIYANDLFVVVGSSGVIATSDDGITWTIRTSNVTNHLYDITYDGNKFIAVGENVYLTSTDGITWASTTISYTNIRNIIYDGYNYILLTGGNNFRYGESLTSLTQKSTTNIMNAACYFDGCIYGVGNNGSLIKSSTGLDSSLQDVINYFNKQIH